MATIFENEADCRTCLQEALGLGAGLPHEAGLLDAFTSCCHEAPHDTRRKEFQLLLNRWVIRDDDLKLFDLVKNAVLALAAVNFVFADMTVAGVSGVVAAIVQMLTNAYRSGATITPSQSKLLIALKNANRPANARSLLKLLAGDKDEGWNDARIRAELNELSCVHTRRGFVELVECNKEGQWTVKGV